MQPGELILGIEISNPSAAGASDRSGPGVAIARASTPGAAEVLGVEMLRPVSGRGGHDDDLMPAIDRLCAGLRLAPAGLRSGGLARVAVSTGPGGYTSLRVAVAAAKMIAEATGARVVDVPTSMVVAAPLRPALFPCAIVLASKGVTAWVEVLDTPARVRSGALCDAAGLAALDGAGVRTMVADHFLPASMRDGAAALGWTVREPEFDPGACAALGAALPAIDGADLLPRYPREPDAVTLWRQRKGASG